MHRMESPACKPPARRKKGTKEDGKKDEVGRADREKSGQEEAMDINVGKQPPCELGKLYREAAKSFHRPNRWKDDGGAGHCPALPCFWC
jgi:hypothetical protein